MSNFDTFSQKGLHRLLGPFIPAAMAPSITPIKYEALTPDLFSLLFRTTDENDAHRFFILLEFDYIADINEAKKIIIKWHGSCKNFLPPHNRVLKPDPTLSDISATYDKSYKGLLAEVNRPVGDGYWASYIFIKPGDSITKKLAHLPREQGLRVAKSLRQIFALSETADSLIEYSVSIYVKPEGGFEYFYN